jgi:hypothetical protein
VSTIAAILRRLDALEARLAPPAVDDHTLEHVLAALDLTAARMRATGWPEPTPEELDASLREFEVMIAEMRA